MCVILLIFTGNRVSISYVRVLLRAHKVRFLVYIADAAVVGESPNVKSKVELKSKVLRIAFACVSRVKC